VLTAETPEGNFTSTLKLERMGEGLAGHNIGREGKETRLRNVRLAGKTLSFEEDVSYDGEELHLVYSGLVEGDQIKGTFETKGLTMSWNAHRPTVSAAELAGVTGTWTITMDTPNGSRDRMLTLKQDGIQLAGTITGFRGETVPLANVSLNGKELRFEVSSERNGVTVKRTYVATLNGDSMKGTIEGGGPSLSFTGKRDARSPSTTARMAGTWKLTVQGPNQTYHPVLTLAEESGKYSGRFLVEAGNEAPLKELVVKGSQLDFTTDLQLNGMLIHVEFSGSVDGDRLKGTVNANGQNLAATGERAPKA
jgi:hypothetical protein